MTSAPRRLARATLIAVLVAAALAIPSAATAAEPLEGRWRGSDGGVLEYFATAPNTFSARVVRRSATLPCPDADGAFELTGSGRTYVGSTAYFRNSDCVFVGRGALRITLSADGFTGAFHSDPPAGCCSFDMAMTRVGGLAAIAPATRLVGDLPVIVNQMLVTFQRQYAALRKETASRSRKRLYALIRSTAISSRTRVQNHNAVPSEQRLKTCATQAITLIVTAATRGVRQIDVGRGLTAISNCLRPFRVLFPGRAPGVTAPRPDPNVRSNQYIGQGTNPQIVQRVDFNLDATANRVLDIHIAVRVNCAGRVEYATFEGFGAPLGGARFGGTYEFPSYRLEFTGNLISGGARGQIQVFGKAGQATCSTNGNHIWIAGRR